MNLDQILARLRNVRPAGAGWISSCPCADAHKHADRQPSLSIREGNNGRPLLYCHAGCNYRDIVAALGLNWTRNEERPHQPPAPSHDLSKNRNAAGAARIWQQSIPIAGTPGERYLRSRCISIIPFDDLRFHPACPHPSGLKLPAMIASVGVWRDGGVEASAIHRTFIRSDGSAKSDIDPAKAMLGRVAGGAVWLSEPAPILAVGEGIETVLSVATAMPDAGYAFAASLSAPNLAVLEIPDWVRELLILVDADKAGERDALALANRATRQELPVRIARPPSPHNDFNDVLRTSQRDAHHDDGNLEATA